MRVGIVGFRGAGKTTVFDTLTGVGAARRKRRNKPQCGVIKVSDPRMENLAGILNLEKTAQAEITLFDFAPGKGDRALDPKSLQRLKEVDALVHVVQCFSHPNQGSAPAPLRAIQDFESELKLTDLVAVENRLAQFKNAEGLEGKTELLGRCKAQLEAERPLRRVAFSEEELAEIACFGFLSLKPLMLVLNVGERDAAGPLPKNIAWQLKKERLLAVTLSGKAELEITRSEEQQRSKRLKELGLKEPPSERFARCFFKLMDLITFLTYSEYEVRAWSIKRGSSALEAAAQVFTDNGMDCSGVEVIQYRDFVRYGGEAKCRQAGKVNSEGKEYIVRDGNVLRFHCAEPTNLW